MLSIFSKIKNKLIHIISNRNTKNRIRNYEVIIGSYSMNAESLDPEDCGISPPPPSPVINHQIFNIEIDETIIKKDYELQELLKTLDIYQIDVKNAILESRIENAIRDMPDATDIAKIKLKLLYVIIANNMYHRLFEERKRYSSIKSSRYIGVFRYNNYIIRIDDAPYSFMNEDTITRASRVFKDITDETNSSIHKNIIRPFLIYTNIRRNIKNEICDCTEPKCDCKYGDEDGSGGNEDGGNEDGDGSDISHVCYRKLRQNTISFSIQYYVKDTTSLYCWVKDTMANNAYNQFYSIQQSFFIHLFHRCALLLREIHSASIVHGDIKPDNILIREHDNFDINHPEKCKNFTVYLIDFGLSGIHNVGVGTGGTIPYCHPEFKNISDTSRSSKYHWKTLNVKHDVWSLGVTFLTMYIYRDFYNYYYKYPGYFFIKDGYVSSLIIDVITNNKINQLFTKILSYECIPSDEICKSLEDIIAS